MTNTPHTREQEIEDEATEWVILHDGGDMSREDALRFDAWLAADARHRAAFHNAQESWREIERIASGIRRTQPCSMHPNTIAFPFRARRHDADPSTTAERLAHHPSRLRIVATLAASVAALVYVGWAALIPPENALITAVGEIRNEVLADGSSVYLNTDTQILVEYTEAARRVVFKKGEAHFTVAHNTERPFIVVTDEGLVRAVGTSFDIFSRDDRVVVVVTDGIVDYIEMPEAPHKRSQDVEGTEVSLPPTKRLVQGERLDFVNATPEVLKAGEEEIERIHAWHQKMFAFSGESLKEVVETLNYHTNQRIIIADKRLETRQIGGRFSAEDIDGVIASLEMLLPVKAVHVTPYLVLLTYDDRA